MWTVKSDVFMPPFLLLCETCLTLLERRLYMWILRHQWFRLLNVFSICQVSLDCFLEHTKLWATEHWGNFSIHRRWTLGDSRLFDVWKQVLQASVQKKAPQATNRNTSILKFTLTALCVNSWKQVISRHPNLHSILIITLISSLN